MVHGHVLLLQVDEESGREAVAHDLAVVPHPAGVVAQLDLGAEGAQHHGLHVRHREPVRPQVAQILNTGRRQVSLLLYMFPYST